MHDGVLHKEVSYRIHGRDLSFFLSMGLFSSNDIDTGTDLLLRQLLEHLDLSSCRSILDAGCGVGTIGIVLGSIFPEAAVTAIDRDALALSATSFNAEHNGLEIRTCSGLDTCLIDVQADRFVSPKESFDLILTNIPAKAGEPVLRRFIHNALSQLNTEGHLGLVIVDTLRETVERLLKEELAVGIWRHDGLRHSVFIAMPDPSEEYTKQISFPGPYKRLEKQFLLGKSSYTLDTVYDIPSFDTIGYDEKLASVLSAGTPMKTLILMNPGQGHVSSYLLQEHPEIEHLILVSRDLLSLYISAHNARGACPDLRITLRHTASESEFLTEERPLDDIPGSMCIIFPQKIPRISSYERIQSAEALTQGKVCEHLVIAAKSSEAAQFTRKIPGFKPVRAKKTHGFRAFIFHCLYL